MDIDEPIEPVVQFVAGSRPVLRVIRAMTDELAEHTRVLQEVDKESKGKCLWLAAAG
jgi:hypothetical protein